MSTTEIRYDITHEDDPEFKTPIAKRHVCILAGLWLAHDGEEAAKAVAVEHMRDVWDSQFAPDDDFATMLVRIMSPKDAVGVFEVDLRKKLVAEGVKRLVDA